MIIFLSTSAFWLALWALREVERRPRFKALAEDNEGLRRRDQIGRHKAEKIRNGLRRIREEFNLSGKAPLPAAAEQSRQLSIQATAPLTGVKTTISTGPSSGYGGPAFSRRQS
jgi:hypothetical protein